MQGSKRGTGGLNFEVGSAGSKRRAMGLNRVVLARNGVLASGKTQKKF